MNNQDKTEEKLIKKLQELQKEYNSLKALYDKDIAEHNQVEKLLRQQSDAMEAAKDGLAITNAEKNFVYMNKSYAAIFGYDNAGELIGRTWHVLYDNEELQRFDREITPKIKLKGYYQGQALGKKKDETIFPQALSLTVLENGGMISTMRDITELKQTEQELIAAKEKAEESSRLKTAFLNNISHEIRTPLNGILGFLSLIQDDDLTGSERNMYTGIINQSADRLMNTINDIVEISQIQAGQIKLTTSETNIKRLTEELLDQFKSDAESQGLEFNITNNLPNNIANIFTDSIKLKTILSNLIGNALKFTKTGSIEFGIRMNGNYLEFSVKDTGIGISENIQQFIFERFNQSDVSTTRQFEGLGLGLSITKSYVEILRGKIWLESEEGKGSTFFFTIPYNTEPEGKVVINNVVSQDVEEHQIKKLKILIVEDDKTAEMLLNMIVKKYCKEDLHARTGEEAVEICRNNPDIDLILMDIQLPEMNGHYATREIRKFNKTVVIIAQTAYARKEDRAKALEAGCNDYISKPIIQNLLTELVKKHCNKLVKH
jgi:PAS domain S-box-containing protein